MHEKLKISTIFDFLGAKAASNCIKEAEQILASNRLIMCGMKNGSCDTEIEVIGSCMQTSASKANPHNISELFCKDKGEWKIKNISCSCKAGASQSCKHCVAVLLYCNEHGLNKLETLSATDLECHWKKNKTNYLACERPIPLQDFCHIKPAPEHRLPERDGKRIYEELLDLLPNSAFAKQRKRFLESKEQTKELPVVSPVENVSLDLKSVLSSILEKKCLPSIDCSMDFADTEMNYYLENISVTKDEAEQLAFETIGQNSNRWFEERKKRITGSICYELFTYAQNKNPDWERKIRRLLFSPFEGNACTAYGSFTEKDACNKYSVAYSVQVLKCGLIVHPDYAFLGFSPDGFIVTRTSEIKLLEIKCPVQGISKPAAELVDHLQYLEVDAHSKYTLRKRHKFYGQVQLGLFLSSIPECDFVIFSSFDSSFVKVTVKRDEEFISKLIPSLRDTFFRHILPVLAKM